MKVLLLVCCSLAAAGFTEARLFRNRRSAKNEYRMCVPEEIFDYCTQMAQQKTKSTAKIVCISARDRFECIEKIKRREADFLTVDPEDMYIAAKTPEQDFAVFEEIRTKEEPEAEFRYEGVAVIHKNLKLNSISDLKGLKSCHTGVGRNVGYKIPITKLKNMQIIGKLNEPGLSARENELKALSELFSKACIVGKWSPDSVIDSKLKKRYSNLCQLCEHPEKCDYPDNFSGYEGALRCLAHNNGDIAWTKVIFVKKFFGLPVGNSPAVPTNEHPEDYAYLCPDGTRVPIDKTPCRWAARPWQGYMGNADVVKTVEELRRKIENLDTEGHKAHAGWLEKVLEISDKNVAKPNKVITPGDYLDKGNYTDVVERDYGPPYKTARFCVTNDDELAKCQALTESAFTRNIRPRFDCVQERSIEGCMKAIRDGAADIITLDAGLANRAEKEFNLRPIVSETYGKSGGIYYTVAVVKKNSLYKSFADLKGAKSCHTGYARTAGYNAPLYTLIKLDLIKKTSCPYPKALADYFSGSCLPGAKNPSLKLNGEIADKLCSLCIGNNGDKSTKCNFDQSESYSGYSGAFRCLVEGDGDVAFVKHVTVPGNTDGKNKEDWAINLKSSDYELLCPNGGRAPIGDYEKCFLSQAPPHMVVTSNTKSPGDIEELQNVLVDLGEQYTERPDLFKLFGSFNGRKDLLFKDSAIGLHAVHDDHEAYKEYKKLLDVINGC
ncbi:transferrin [Onthophagus taurus]|uniref:transferrin n=1 Tax=Onthophagus taurus TaxID=166361 RepID=UPI000C1FDDA0|nr:transferrin [Onthophagus taurus]